MNCAVVLGRQNSAEAAKRLAREMTGSAGVGGPCTPPQQEQFNQGFAEGATKGESKGNGRNPGKQLRWIRQPAFEKWDGQRFRDIKRRLYLAARLSPRLMALRAKRHMGWTVSRSP